MTLYLFNNIHNENIISWSTMVVGFMSFLKEGKKIQIMDIQKNTSSHMRNTMSQNENT